MSTLVSIQAEALLRWRERQRQEQAATISAWRDQAAASCRIPHAQQVRFLESPSKRKVIRAGRRGGKTVGMALLAVRAFLAGRRILYAVPTQEQMDRFWFECKLALSVPLDAGILYKNETRHIIELTGTENRIRAKTAWNADTLRGDYAETLILDEYQLMAEEAWGTVGAPMMADKNGDAVFVFTPPSFRTSSVSKARDKQHATKLYRDAAKDTTGRWEVFHFASQDNPHISAEALEDLASDMTDLAYRQEILAEDLEDNPASLWRRELIIYKGLS
jgi:hypothetical protein